ncbi:hypothetical protein BDW22DRAFT_1419482 [Trametopsis cervina]|nr:hypothetical protein BDW22DRAFT_1419482 [Trametopsis cervina]
MGLDAAGVTDLPSDRFWHDQHKPIISVLSVYNRDFLGRPFGALMPRSCSRDAEAARVIRCIALSPAAAILFSEKLAKISFGAPGGGFWIPSNVHRFPVNAKSQGIWQFAIRVCLKAGETQWGTICKPLRMHVMKPILSIGLCALVGSVAAQQTEWQQCGGRGYTGPTICAAGLVCTVENEYFSQCFFPATTAATQSTTTPPTTVTSLPSQPPPFDTSINYWFSFGDSYTQTGFTINGTKPSVGNPLGNPPYPGHTAVGGVNWIDVNTVQYNHSLLLTYNFAYGGATIDSSLIPPYDPSVVSLKKQVGQFLNSSVGKPSAAVPWRADNTLFSFWIGINDIGNSYYLSGDRSAFSDTLLDAYFALVQKIFVNTLPLQQYNAGGRNFLFINVPPVDRSPLMVPQGTSATNAEKTVIAGFNSKLAQRVAKLASTGVKTWLFDSNAAFTTVLNNPTKYGFVDNTSYGNAGDFWGNNYHPSSAAQTIFGQQISQLLKGTFW